MQWYGAFHNTTHHPHVHLLVYSKSGQGYLTNNGIESMRSSFGNDIFRNEQYKLFEMQTEIRDELKNEAKNVIDDLLENINNDFYVSDKMVELFRKTCRTAQKLQRQVDVRLSSKINQRNR